MVYGPGYYHAAPLNPFSAQGFFFPVQETSAPKKPKGADRTAEKWARKRKVQH
jgi:hypothetical protein